MFPTWHWKFLLSSFNFPDMHILKINRSINFENLKKLKKKLNIKWHKIMPIVPDYSSFKHYSDQMHQRSLCNGSRYSEEKSRFDSKFQNPPVIMISIETSNHKKNSFHWQKRNFSPNFISLFFKFAYLRAYEIGYASCNGVNEVERWKHNQHSIK